MLRTRMSPQAVSSAVAALPWLAAGVAGAAIAATMGWPPGVGIGLLVFAAALAPGVLLPLARAALGKSPSTYATWTLTAGLGWIVVSVAAVAIVAMTSATTADMRVTNLPWLALLGIGGAGQVFVGALTYLLPVVVGGGPSALRRGMSVLEVGWPTRIAVRNAALGLVAIASASGSDLGSWWWGLVLMTYALDVTLLSVAGARQARAKVAALRTRAVAGAAGTEDAPSGGSRD
jgi:nitrite reductase (NO-forming)